MSRLLGFALEDWRSEFADLLVDYGAAKMAAGDALHGTPEHRNAALAAVEPLFKALLARIHQARPVGRSGKK